MLYVSGGKIKKSLRRDNCEGGGAKQKKVKTDPSHKIPIILVDLKPVAVALCSKNLRAMVRMYGPPGLVVLYPLYPQFHLTMANCGPK